MKKTVDQLGNKTHDLKYYLYFVLFMYPWKKFIYLISNCILCINFVKITVFCHWQSIKCCERERDSRYSVHKICRWVHADECVQRQVNLVVAIHSQTAKLPLRLICVWTEDCIYSTYIVEEIEQRHVSLSAYSSYIIEGRNVFFFILSKKRVEKWRKQKYETQKELLYTKNVHAFNLFRTECLTSQRTEFMKKSSFFYSSIYTLKKDVVRIF